MEEKHVSNVVLLSQQQVYTKLSSHQVESREPCNLSSGIYLLPKSYQARKKQIFFGQAKFDRHDHAYCSMIQREHSINAFMHTSTFAHAHAHYSASTQLVTPPFSHKYWSGQNRTNRTGCAGPAYRLQSRRGHVTLISPHRDNKIQISS